MRKFTRTLSCTLIAALLLTVAATAAACGKKAEYPTVSEVTGSQAAGEVIPAVDRQEQLAAAKKANPDAVAWLYMPGQRVLPAEGREREFQRVGLLLRPL